jgi:4-carboxymuconolactone decarboxylase
MKGFIMKTSTIVALALSMGSVDAAAQTGAQTGSLSREDVRAVSPALERYATDKLANGLWKRPGLSPRDRSIVTVAAVITRNQGILLPEQLNLALDNGVKPAEISEIITHLAFYAGWGNAVAAIPIAQSVFQARGVTPSALPPAAGPLLPLDQTAEAQRAALVEQTMGPVSAGLVEYTADVLFKELWLRPGLTPRDRSLVTVSALIATGQVAQVTFHLNRAMDSGLTREEAGEVITHLAFYAGWPNAFSAGNGSFVSATAPHTRPSAMLSTARCSSSALIMLRQ